MTPPSPTPDPAEVAGVIAFRSARDAMGPELARISDETCAKIRAAFPNRPKIKARLRAQLQKDQPDV